MSTFGDQVFQYGGQPIGGALGASPFGNAYFVDYRNGSTSYDGKTPKTAKKTFAQAYALVTSNNNDVIYIDGDSGVVETAMTTITKNRFAVIGVNGLNGHMGQGARISLATTTVATDLCAINNQGVRVTFSGIKFSNNSTKDESIYGHIEAGEYARYFNCSFYESADIAVTGAAELLHNGDSAMFYNCTFGSTANETGGVHANVLVTATISGKKLRDGYFENCIFDAKADDTDKVFVYGANATDVERRLMFKNCEFFNTELASGVPAHAIGFGAKQTEGLVAVKNCTAWNCTKIAQEDMGIWVDGGPPTMNTTGIALEETS